MLPRVWHAVHERSATAIELPSDDLLEKLKALSRPDASPERGVEMSMDGTGIDLFPLTVPHGFGWRRDWALLWADVISERAQTIRVSTGADWYMAWACNGRVVLDRTTPAGNEQPPSPLDHLVEIELRAGSNRIGVLVIAGMEGFCLHCQVAPADLEARQTRAVEERVHTARRRVEQLHHPARVQVDANRVVGTLPAPHQHASISLDMADDLTLTQAEAHWGRQQFVRAFAVIRDGFLMSDDYTPAPDDAHDRRLAAVARRADDIMYPLPMTGVTQVLSGQLDEATYVRRMARAMRHARAIAPQARWAEVFNESEVDRLSNIV
ncbi:MAG TPA: hypothetical protein PKB10_15470, partial [Tepidisphaeraceae bacterium]|nr:hypothetical protein [Tepidisphaeraceae bacterium]